MKKFLITADGIISGIRIDKAISSLDDSFTRSYIQKIIDKGFLLVNGKKTDKNYILKNNDLIEISIKDAEPLQIVPENISLDIKYEDNDLLVVNKPRGMVVHPAPGNYTGTLVSALMFHCGDSLSGINGIMRPGIVHRIDKDTSGLLIIAKNDFSHKMLAEQIQAHSFKREYVAIVHGRIKNEDGTINAPIGRHQIDRKKMAVTFKNSRNAITHFKVAQRYSEFTRVILRLETGRTHQIRVHMSYIGHPVAGDMVYGPKNDKTNLGGQCLHAKLIGFKHPSTGKYIEIESELPDYFVNFIKVLNFNK